MRSAGAWQGSFKLSGDGLRNPDDERAPYALSFNPRRWTAIAPVPVPHFRGWRYLESLPSPAPRRPTKAEALRGPDAKSLRTPSTTAESLRKGWCYFHSPTACRSTSTTDRDSWTHCGPFWGIRILDRASEAALQISKSLSFWKD